MNDIVTDLNVTEKDTATSCIFDFPDRPVRPDPPVDPIGGPPDEYPYNPVWDWPPLDPHPNVDPDDPNKGNPPDPSSVPSTHWLHQFQVTPDLGVYHYHGKSPHEIWMYRQIGLGAGNVRIGKLVCKRNVQETSPTDLSTAPITFWDKPRKTDFETYTPLTADGISSLNPAGQHVMFYWFLFRFYYVGLSLQHWVMAIAGGFEPTILVGNDSQTHPATTFWTPLANRSGQIVNGSHAVMVRNTKHTNVGVNVSIS